MKRIDTYITEKFQVSKDYKRQYTYTPKDKYELMGCIEKKMEKEGYEFFKKDLDLNDIDTSRITDMSNLFDIMGSNNRKLVRLSQKGNFDISDWDVSNVTNMESMFYCSAFNGDISDWDVSNVENMRWMFAGSYFDGDISKWDVRKLSDTAFMFFKCKALKNKPAWYKE